MYGLRLLSAFFLLPLLAAVSPAQSPTQPVGYPVQLNGQTMFHVRWGVASYTAQERAATITRRLLKVAQDPTIAINVESAPQPGSIVLSTGDVALAGVYPGDAQAENTTQDVLAARWAAAMQQGLIQYRHQYSWRHILLRTAVTLVIVVVCVWLLLLVRRSTYKLANLVSRWLGRRLQASNEKLRSIITPSHINGYVLRIFLLIRILLWIVVLYIAVQLTLAIFPATRGLSQQWLAAVQRPIQNFGATLWNSVPSLTFVILLAYATWLVVKFVRFFFSRVGSGSIILDGFDPAWAPTTRRLVTFGLIVLAVLVAYPYIPGSRSEAFKGISIFLGVLFSLGSTGLVANVLSGIMLTYMGAFRVGDLVQIGETRGWIVSTTLLTTRVRTRKNELVSIPNSIILADKVVNLTAQVAEGLLITSTVGIGYETPWRQVEGMLLLAASRTADASKEPAPFVLVRSLNTFDVTYDVYIHLAPGASVFQASNDLNRNVLDAFNEFGVQIMTPAYVADPATDKIVPRDKWYTSPASSGDAAARAQLDRQQKSGS
jgi:small-conductance mechanosensitive channel